MFNIEKGLSMKFKQHINKKKCVFLISKNFLTILYFNKWQ